MTGSKTLANAIHGAHLHPTKREPAVEGAPPTKSDRISSKAKLIMAELVTAQWKRVYTLNQGLVKKLQDTAANL